MKEEELIKKNKLISTYMREVKSLFLKINKENAKNIIATGNPISADKFSNDWESLLNKHYDRVQASFKGSVGKTLPEEDQGFSNLEETIMVSFLLDWGGKSSKRNASEITRTTSKQIFDSTAKARAVIIEQELSSDRFTLAMTTASIFRRMFNSRISKIAVFSTQEAAELAKVAEAIVLSGGTPNIDLNPIISSKNLGTKKWNDSRDDKVRDLHLALNGVEIKINQPFFSGGEQLMFPCDVSLGATAKNIFNCRCFLTYKITRIRR